MPFGGQSLEHIKKMRNLGKFRKIRFKDKDKYFKHRELKKETPSVIQTEEEKAVSRAKVREEMKAERRTIWLKLLKVLFLFIAIVWFFLGGIWWIFGQIRFFLEGY